MFVSALRKALRLSRVISRQGWDHTPLGQSFISQVLCAWLCVQCSFNIQIPKEEITQDQPHLTEEATEAQRGALCSGGALSGGGADSLAVESPPLTSLPPTLTSGLITLIIKCFKNIQQKTWQRTGTKQLEKEMHISLNIINLIFTSN